MGEDNISKIKDRLNVVDVLAGYIKVQKAGINFKARCPFHNEKTPSFYISPERQIWHCFGCLKGGDIFGFIKEIEGVEFPEALRILAQRAGIELESYDPAMRDEKTKLYEICETASRFFEKQLSQSNVGKRAFEYLTSRGLLEPTIKEFRLGFAPNEWEALTGFLKDCGYKEKEIVESGMAIKREGGSGIYDRFRSRIMFPINDANDQVVGFTGRIFAESSDPRSAVGFGEERALAKEESQAKYINTPQTAIYDKSRVLYGLNKSKMEVRKANRCLLVEGNMDVIMSYQSGTKNVVASSGTALTGNHLQVLKRYTDNLDFCFDTDQAGALATRRGIGMALSHNFNVKVVQIGDPECKDPADYVKKYGQAWQKIVDSSKPVVEFYFNKSQKESDIMSPEWKKAILVSVGPLIKRLTSKVEQSHWISQLALSLRAGEADIKSDLETLKDDLSSYEHSAPETVEIKRSVAEGSKLESDILSEAVLAIVIRNPTLFKEDIKNLDYGLLRPFAARTIKELSVTEPFSFNDFIKKFDTETALKLEFAYIGSQELWKDFKDEDLKKEFHGMLQKLERRNVVAKLTGLEFEIKEAEMTKNKDKLATLLAEFNKLAQKLSR